MKFATIKKEFAEKFATIKERAIKLFHSKLFWIQVCAVGIWLLVIQNYFGCVDNVQRVYVVGGYIDDVDHTVSVEVDNIVPVEVENTVSVETWNW